jgi:pSer/pThr/pTyr-binding forkhead associated (FHA) protein
MFAPMVFMEVREGNLRIKEISTNKAGQWLVGRCEDCDIRLLQGYGAGEIARHHCVFEIAPPSVRVSDLGSMNGTFVNDKKIGPQAHSPKAAPEQSGDILWHNLYDGDIVQVGHTLIRIHVFLEKADHCPDPVLWL